MDIRVALVDVDRRYLVDRVVAGLRGGQRWSHGALIVHQVGLKDEWWDMHHRWLASSLRRFPAENYAWPYSIWRVPGLGTPGAERIYHWLLEQDQTFINYDLPQCAWTFLMSWLGVQETANPWGYPRSYHCFELIARALEVGGLKLPMDPSSVLGEDLVASGLLLRMHQ